MRSPFSHQEWAWWRHICVPAWRSHPLATGWLWHCQARPTHMENAGWCRGQFEWWERPYSCFRDCSGTRKYVTITTCMHALYRIPNSIITSYYFKLHNFQLPKIARPAVYLVQSAEIAQRPRNSKKWVQHLASYIALSLASLSEWMLTRWKMFFAISPTLYLPPSAVCLPVCTRMLPLQRISLIDSIHCTSILKTHFYWRW